MEQGEGVVLEVRLEAAVVEREDLVVHIPGILEAAVAEREDREVHIPEILENSGEIPMVS